MTLQRNKPQRNPQRNSGRNSSGKREPYADLIPGLVATIAFLGMGWLLGVSLIWLSGLLAIGVYLGIRWLMPAIEAQEEAQPIPARELLKQIRQIQPQIRLADVQQRVQGVCDWAGALLDYCDKYPENAAESLFLVRQYLQLTQTGVTLFLETERSSQAAALQSRHKLNELLDSVLERFTRLHEGLVAQDSAALTGELNVLTKTLDELDKVCLTLGSTE